MNVDKLGTKEEEKSYRYETDRYCYRQDETHYVYREWVETGKGKGYYIDHIFTVGECGITLELLDVLQEEDDREEQESENVERYEEPFDYDENDAADNDFDYYDNINVNYMGKKDIHNLAASYKGSPEFIGPEAVLFADREPGKAEIDFNRHVRPKLSEDQINLIYDYFGMAKTIQQIVDEFTDESDGTSEKCRTLSDKWNLIFTKVKELMPKR